MPLFYQKVITRQLVRANPGVLFVFGDNVRRRGLKGQAAEMRGEFNAVGVATKWAPDNQQPSFFKDKDEDRIIPIMEKDLEPVVQALSLNRIVIWPADGIGTGLSKLPESAPKIWEKLEDARKQLENIT